MFILFWYLLFNLLSPPQQIYNCPQLSRCCLGSRFNFNFLLFKPFENGSILCLESMPRPSFAYVPDVLPGGTNIPEDSEAGDWFHSLNDSQLADYLRQLDEMLDSFDSSYLTIFAVENPLAALERCRGNLNCLVRYLFILFLYYSLFLSRCLPTFRPSYSSTTPNWWLLFSAYFVLRCICYAFVHALHPFKVVNLLRAAAPVSLWKVALISLISSFIIPRYLSSLGHLVSRQELIAIRALFLFLVPCSRPRSLYFARLISRRIHLLCPFLLLA